MEENKFSGWGLVEIMGHQRIAGRLGERSIAGTNLLQVDVPTGDGPDDFRTQFVGGGSIYALHPTDEKTARALAKRLGTRPTYAYDVEAQLRIEARTAEQSGSAEGNVRVWVVIRWARTVKPRVIMLENVEEFATWGPLLADGTPCPLRKGLTFRRWRTQLENCGYQVEMRELRACDYGAPTIRKRLFIIARCDGRPIVWPKPTHGPRRKPYRTAAECIDWSIPCPSIFERERPLAPATLRRIATGIYRYVINCADPFIVPITHTGSDRVHSIREPLRTITTAQRGELSLIAPTLIQTSYGERQGQAPRTLDLHEPLGTVVAGGVKHSLVAAFLAQHNTNANGAPKAGRSATDPLSTIVGTGGQQQIVTAWMEQANTDMVGHDARKPLSTIVGKGCTQRIATAHLLKMYGTSQHGQDVRDPLHTVTANGKGGGHFAEVRAFLMQYYGDGGSQTRSLRDPMPIVVSKDRIGLVTIHGTEYAIVDIGMRMLSPRELFRAQGFDDSYVIDPVVNGKPLTKTAQVRMCGNSVCPPVSEALVRANFQHERKYQAVA